MLPLPSGAELIAPAHPADAPASVPLAKRSQHRPRASAHRPPAGAAERTAAAGQRSGAQAVAERITQTDEPARQPKPKRGDVPPTGHAPPPPPPPQHRGGAVHCSRRADCARPAQHRGLCKFAPVQNVRRQMKRAVRSDASKGALSKGAIRKMSTRKSGVDSKRDRTNAARKAAQAAKGKGV